MYKLVVLNNIAPKLRSKRESIDAHIRNWYTSGYRTGAPGTNTCRGDTDCEPGEICQSGYCAGLHRKYDTHGLFYGAEYADLLSDQNSIGYLQHGDFYRPHDFFYDYSFGDLHHGNIKINQPHSVGLEKTTDYDYSYDQ